MPVWFILERFLIENSLSGKYFPEVSISLETLEKATTVAPRQIIHVKNHTLNLLIPIQSKIKQKLRWQLGIKMIYKQQSSLQYVNLKMNQKVD